MIVDSYSTERAASGIIFLRTLRRCRLVTCRKRIQSATSSFQKASVWMSMMNTLSTLDMMSMHEHYEHDEHDESALSSLAEHHEHDEHAEHAVVGCIPAIAFRSIDSMNGIPAILCLVGLVSCIRCVLYRVSTCTRNTIAQSPMLTSYKQTHSAAIHVHRRSARVIRLQACNDLTKTARSVAFRDVLYARVKPSASLSDKWVYGARGSRLEYRLVISVDGVVRVSWDLARVTVLRAQIVRKCTPLSTNSFATTGGGV